MTKETIRDLMRKQKRQMSMIDIQQKSDDIFKKLECLPEWKEYSIVYCYVSYNQEVNTKERMWNWIEKGKTVAVPKVEGEQLVFYAVRQKSDLLPGYQGILEPVAREPIEGKVGIMIMPGLAFDQKKHRMGYGGGFYDRYLERFPKSQFYKVACGYDYQLLEEIPTQEHDIAVDLIVTEHRIIR